LQKLKFKLYGDVREQVVGGWRRLHNEELHNLCTLPNIVRAIKSKRIDGQKM
jgi:hypothetical protein